MHLKITAFCAAHSGKRQSLGAVVTEYRRLGTYRQQETCLLHFWRLGNGEQCASVVGFWWGPSRGSRLLTSPLHGRETEAAPWSLSLRALTPSGGPHPCDLIISQKPHLLSPSHWDEMSTYEFRRNTFSPYHQSSATLMALFPCRTLTDTLVT